MMASTIFVAHTSGSAPSYNRQFMNSPYLLPAIMATALLGACSTVAEKTNFLSDADLIAKAAGPLGYSPSALTLLNRRNDGTNTYVTVRASDRKEFVCTVNGGNLLSMGLTNPPDCRAR